MAKNKKTLQDREQDALFAEVWDDVRQQKAMDFFKKYGKYILATAIILLVFVGGKQFYTQYRGKAMIQEAEQYEQAMNQNLFTNAREAEQAFIELAEEGRYGYQALSYFNRVNVLLGQRKADDAITILKQAVKNIRTKEMKHLAILKLALLEMDSVDSAALEDRIDPLLSDDSPFYFTAHYLMGMVYVKEDKKDQAIQSLEVITKHDMAPQELRVAALDVVGFLSAQ